MGEWLCINQSILQSLLQSPIIRSPFNQSCNQSRTHHALTPITTFTLKKQQLTPYRPNNVTTGASSDLQQASAIARGLVYEYGMMGVKPLSANHI